MDISHITDVEALLFVGGILAFAYIVFRVIPSGGYVPPKKEYTEEEIRSYDSALPKYFIAAAAALALGGLHGAIKSIPPIYAWLSAGGHGGHMVRDLANTHLIIVIGGTVAATGLTWYVLPRIARRPLASRNMATWSFWLTMIGAGGFYLANVVLGVYFAQLQHQGLDYDTAKPMVGLWRAIPIGMSAGIMGFGYWTFVLEVVLTVIGARHVAGEKPHGHLLKYFVVGAGGLFIGTVQGVIQVLPDNEAWIHASAPAGQYIDPIAHAHVNLVTGTLSLVAGLVFYWTARAGRGARWGGRRIEQVVFWTMVPGSLLFYLTFMYLGFTEGHLMTDQGMSFQEAEAYLGAAHIVPLMIAGILTIVGVWLLLLTILRRALRLRALHVPGTLLVAAGCVALFVGTTQGLIQILPPVKAWLVAARDPGDAIPNAHAQLNMLGGVIPMLLGLTLAFAPRLVGEWAPARTVGRVFSYVSIGVAVYWVAAVLTPFLEGEGVIAGLPLSAAVARVEPFGPLAMAYGSATYMVGFAIFFAYVWRSTAAYRRQGWADFRGYLRRYDGSSAPWRQRIPARYFLLAEVAGAAMGFPGFGWILSGRPLVGLPIALASPGIAWAVIPLLAAPTDTGPGPLTALGSIAIVIYLAATTALSVSALAYVVLWRPYRRRSQARQLGREAQAVG